MTQSYMTDALNNVIEYLHDSRNGFKTCASDIEDATFQAWFNKLTLQRQNMITALQNAVKLIGDKPETSGTVTGAAHRLYVNLKSLVTGGNREAIMNEVKRGENILIEQYRQTLTDSNLPEHIRMLLNEQLAEIEACFDEIEALAD